MLFRCIGTCKECLKLQQITADLSCHVVELADAYEVILVLIEEKEFGYLVRQLSFAHRCYVLIRVVMFVHTGAWF